MNINPINRSLTIHAWILHAEQYVRQAMEVYSGNAVFVQQFKGKRSRMERPSEAVDSSNGGGVVRPSHLEGIVVNFEKDIRQQFRADLVMQKLSDYLWRPLTTWSFSMDYMDNIFEDVYEVSPCPARGREILGSIMVSMTDSVHTRHLVGKGFTGKSKLERKVHYKEVSGAW